MSESHNQIRILLLDDRAGTEVDFHLYTALTTVFGEHVAPPIREIARRVFKFAHAGGTLTIHIDMVDDSDRATELIKSHEKLDEYDLVLVDNDWEQAKVRATYGLQLLGMRDRSRSFGPIVAIYTSAPIEHAFVSEALSYGAKALIRKTEPTHLLNVLVLSLERAPLRELDRQLEQMTGDFVQNQYLNAANSPAMRACIKRALLYAPSSNHIALIGERGSGKTMLAEQIHLRSPRAGGPYRYIDLAQTPPDLVEASLFGYTRGAYTGAEKDSRGILAEAAGGTVLIDDFQTASMALQTKLRAVFGQGTYMRVGDSSTVHKADVRFIIAFNRDPADLIADGKLAEDIWDRIKTLTIKIPPLRERLEDIPMLAKRFFEDAWRLERASAAAPELSVEALEALTAQPWPDNVRGLKIVMQRLAIHLPNAAEAVKAKDLEMEEGGAGDASAVSLSDSESRSLIALPIRTGTQRQILALLVRGGGRTVPVMEMNKLVHSDSPQVSPSIHTALSRLRDRLQSTGFTIEPDTSGGVIKGYRLVKG